MKYSCLKFVNLNFWDCVPPMGGCQLSPHSTCNDAKTRASKMLACAPPSCACSFFIGVAKFLRARQTLDENQRATKSLWACQNLVGFSLARNQTASVLCKCYQCNGKYVQSQVI
uniref:Uncharacterized protein n=1 Tax=Arundo donax TaxID=35708 RepID=A0A0A9GAP1_ARUDO